MSQHNNLDFSTRAVHIGNEIDKETGAIRRPITMANSYALPYDPTDMNWSSADGNLYTRNGGANQKYLQEKLASLEGGDAQLSHDIAMQIFQLEEAQSGEGLAKFLEMLPREYPDMLDSALNAGLDSPFDPGRLEAVADTMRRILLEGSAAKAA